jgi:large subunit ribosomal protein L32
LTHLPGDSTITGLRHVAAGAKSASAAVEESRKPGRTMAVPKRKHSNARTGSRRAHDSLRARQLLKCPGCSTPVPSHVVCPNCGHYMGREVVATEEKAAKKKKKT